MLYLFSTNPLISKRQCPYALEDEQRIQGTHQVSVSDSVEVLNTVSPIPYTEDGFPKL